MGVVIVSFIIIIVFNRLFAKALLDFSLSRDGILRAQSHYKDPDNNPLILFFAFMQSIGGSNELAFICGLTFIYGRRPKFFYYLTAYCFNKLTNGILKLIYHEPRPYMFIPKEKLDFWRCPTTFGQPSGHTTDAGMMAIFMFLDIFHGTEKSLFEAFKQSQTIQLNKEFKINYFSNLTYFAGLTFAIVYLLLYPYLRFLFAVHSLD